MIDFNDREFDNALYKLDEIIDHFGEKRQLQQLRNELVELVDEVNKEICAPNEENGLFKGIVDVIIMLTQIMLIKKYSSKALSEQFVYKVNRTIKRIETGFYE